MAAATARKAKRFDDERRPTARRGVRALWMLWRPNKVEAVAVTGADFQ
jgi:hypothetical protein